MEHGKKNRKFGRETKQRKELMRDLAHALILKGRIMTTQAKAKSLKPYIEKLITKSKAANLSATRTISSQIGFKYAKKLIAELGPHLAQRNGGYTRILNLPRRLSDGARMAMIEFVQ